MFLTSDITLAVAQDKQVSYYGHKIGCTTNTFPAADATLAVAHDKDVSYFR